MPDGHSPKRRPVAITHGPAPALVPLSPAAALARAGDSSIGRSAASVLHARLAALTLQELLA